MINPDTFTPTFCPYAECSLHTSEAVKSIKSKDPWSRNGTWYQKKGRRLLANGRAVQIYRCKHCGRYFCSRTYSIDYYGKRTYSYHRILKMLISNMGVRAIARALNCSPASVQNKVQRLGRQAIALKAILSQKIELSEDLCADGFESFAGSQYHPNNFNLLVGKDSQFTYFFNYSQLRRKGRMTDQQKEKAEELRIKLPLAPGQIRYRFIELTDMVVKLQQGSKVKKVLTVYTDEKPEYAEPLAFLAHGGVEIEKGYKIMHHTTSSRQRRDASNPLFSVNYMDRELRKDLAEHVRETVRFARNVNNSIGRAEVHQFHHNFIKPYRVNVSERAYETHAHAAGLDPKEVSRKLSHWMSRRCFFSHLELDLHSQKVWCGDYATPGKLYIDYVPAYVFQ
jgi:transposase-like protein